MEKIYQIYVHILKKKKTLKIILSGAPQKLGPALCTSDTCILYLVFSINSKVFCI
jgi:hypothetical protein